LRRCGTFISRKLNRRRSLGEKEEVGMAQKLAGGNPGIQSKKRDAGAQGGRGGGGKSGSGNKGGSKSGHGGNK
jgi:hypothetical protein